MAFYVYMLASKRNGTLYIGMTDDLVKRVWMHREGILPGFTRDYDVKQLVWYEAHESREPALLRERQMKKWNRSWKIDLIERCNPQWSDLGEGLTLEERLGPRFRGDERLERLDSISVRPREGEDPAPERNAEWFIGLPQTTKG